MFEEDISAVPPVTDMAYAASIILDKMNVVGTPEELAHVWWNVFDSLNDQRVARYRGMQKNLKRLRGY